MYKFMNVSMDKCCHHDTAKRLNRFDFCYTMSKI